MNLDAYINGTISFQDLMKSTARNEKESGAVYTPASIVDALIEGSNPTQNDIIWEPACGHGAFVVPVMETVCKDWDFNATFDWFTTHLFANDINPTTITELRLIICAWFKRTYQVDIEPQTLTNIFVGDGLKILPPKSPTLIIGNPPYIRFQNLPDTTRTFLAQTYKSCEKGNVDIYYAFLERALIAERAAFIVPNAFLTTKSAQTLRTLLNKSLDYVKDFEDTKVFEGVGTYTALVFLNKNNPRKIVENTTTTKPFAPALKRPAPIREVRGPIATLCDKAFLVKKTDKGFINPTTQLPIEAGIVKPLLKLSTLHRHDLTAWETYILYPYENETPIEEHTLKTRFPQAYEHLTQMRKKLDNRDKGKTHDYPAWYAYGRKQGLRPLTGPTALIVPGMITSTLLPRVIDITSLQNPLIVSGFAIDSPNEEDIKSLTDPSFLSFVQETVSPKPGKDETYYPIPSWIVKGHLAP